jgi:hypothetical protein
MNSGIGRVWCGTTQRLPDVPALSGLSLFLNFEGRSADNYVPHFHNTIGVKPVIEIGSRIHVRRRRTTIRPSASSRHGDATEIIAVLPRCSGSTRRSTRTRRGRRNAR